MNGQHGNTARADDDVKRSEQERDEERHQQEGLDEALDESFPASDPPSPYMPERRKP